MSAKQGEVSEFLLNRRSFPAAMLGPPLPDRQELSVLLTAAARVPDHGMLVPWRFIVIEKGAMGRLSEQLRTRGLEMGKAESLVNKAAEVFARANLIVAVVASPDPSSKFPLIEQTLSAGAVCLSLLNTALARGWGASWVTGFGAHDSVFRESALGLNTDEFVAGFVHIGTCERPPAERPRPGLDGITKWVNA